MITDYWGIPGFACTFILIPCSFPVCPAPDPIVWVTVSGPNIVLILHLSSLFLYYKCDMHKSVFVRLCCSNNDLQGSFSFILHADYWLAVFGFSNSLKSTTKKKQRKKKKSILHTAVSMTERKKTMSKPCHGSYSFFPECNTTATWYQLHGQAKH